MRHVPHNSISRRSFLTARSHNAAADLAIRPPWSDEASIQSSCTSCEACIEACPENILFADPKGQPEVRFHGDECTFCKVCVTACKEAVFDTTRTTPWSLKAAINSDCLLKSGVTCQVCTDNCDVEALRFDPRERPVGGIVLDLDTCTGCSACTTTCPASAISMSYSNQEITA